jgi:hypothetical protein
MRCLARGTLFSFSRGAKRTRKRTLPVSKTFSISCPQPNRKVPEWRTLAEVQNPKWISRMKRISFGDGVTEQEERVLEIKNGVPSLEPLPAALPSNPPSGCKKILNMFWDPDTKETVIVTED